MSASKTQNVTTEANVAPRGQARGPIPMEAAQMIAAEDLMDTAAVALLLRLSEWTIREMNRNGKLPAPVKHPWRGYLWKRDELEAWAKAKYPDLFKS